MFCIFMSVIMHLWQMRVQILQSYVSDLTEQNAVLIKTFEDMEEDATLRVGRLISKLRKSSDVIKVI